MAGEGETANGNKNNAKESAPEDTKKSDKTGKAKDDKTKAEPPLIDTDFQLYEALSLLKGYSFLQQKN